MPFKRCGTWRADTEELNLTVAERHLMQQTTRILQRGCLVILVGSVLLGFCGCAESPTKAEPPPGAQSSAAVPQQGTAVVCNKFDIVANLQGTTLDIRLDTDLPDFTEIMVSVSRSYREKGNTESRYPISYFSEKSTVRKWRKSHPVSVADQVFRDALQKQMDRMAALGVPFEVADIEDTIDVSITVPLYQANPAFGPENINLEGQMVAKEGSRVVRRQAQFRKPLDDNADSLGLAARKACWSFLEVGSTYRLSAATPLMPEFEPRDPVAAIAGIVKLPPGSRIVVLRTRMQGSRPWYYVSAYDPNDDGIGNGWINSGALIGKDIHVVQTGRKLPKRPVAALVKTWPDEPDRGPANDGQETNVALKGPSQRVESGPGESVGKFNPIRPSSPAYRHRLPSGAMVITNPFVSTCTEKTYSGFRQDSVEEAVAGIPPADEPPKIRAARELLRAIEEAAEKHPGNQRYSAQFNIINRELEAYGQAPVTASDAGNRMKRVEIVRQRLAKLYRDVKVHRYFNGISTAWRAKLNEKSRRMLEEAKRNPMIASELRATARKFSDAPAKPNTVKAELDQKTRHLARTEGLIRKAISLDLSVDASDSHRKDAWASVFIAMDVPREKFESLLP